MLAYKGTNVLSNSSCDAYDVFSVLFVGGAYAGLPRIFVSKNGINASKKLPLSWRSISFDTTIPKDIVP